MTRLRDTAIRSLLVLTCAVTAVVLVTAQKAGAPARRIAVFGSSVANGTGDDLGKEGYTGRLRELLAPRGWEVLNQSRGGDNTKTMAPRFEPVGDPDPKVRYLLPVNPGYVLLGLSLGNEGIQNGTTKSEKDAVYDSIRIGHARLRRAQPPAPYRACHHALLHEKRLHASRVPNTRAG